MKIVVDTVSSHRPVMLNFVVKEIPSPFVLSRRIRKVRLVGGPTLAALSDGWVGGGH